MAEKPEPVKVLYCGVCGLPAEYCEFGPEFDKCKPWLIQNAPDLYPDLPKDDADVVSEQLQSTSISSSSGASSTPKPEEVKRLPGGKVKKKERKEVIIEKVVRNKRKCITTVKGLELFAVKLSDASKKLGKKFATGASVVKGPTEKEQIDVQGDISFDVVEFITDTIPPFSSFASKLQYQYSTSWVVKLLHYSGYWHRLVSLFLHRNVDEYALNGENILLPYFWMQKHELRKFTARPIILHLSARA